MFMNKDKTVKDRLINDLQLVSSLVVKSWKMMELGADINESLKGINAAGRILLLITAELSDCPDEKEIVLNYLESLRSTQTKGDQNVYE